MGIFLSVSLFLFSSANFFFHFNINSSSYFLEISQDSFPPSIQFAEHTSDGNFWVFTYPSNNILWKMNHNSDVLKTIRLTYFSSNVVYTTTSGYLLSTSDTNSQLWFFDKDLQRWYSTGAYINWLGTWSIDEKDGVIMIAEYNKDTSPYARVFRSHNDGKVWDIVFYQRALGSEDPQVRHFHTLQVDPYTGDWYLTSGDRPQECKVWKSNDDGDTWIDVTDYDLDPSQPPKLKTQSLFRLTTMWFTPEYICWATDDRINLQGAQLVISPRTEPLDIRVLGRVSYNEVRSAIEFPNIGWLLITENNHGYIGIELTFVTTDFHIIPLGVLEGITGYFTSSVASKKADWLEDENCWVAYSLARGLIPRIMRYKLERCLRLDVTSNDSAGGEIIINPNKGSMYEEGDIVHIQVRENPGYIFTGWEGDYPTAKKTLTITMTKDVQLKAHFYPIDTEPDYKVPVSSVLSCSLLIGIFMLSFFLYSRKMFHY